MYLNLNYGRLYELNMKTVSSFYKELKSEQGFLEYVKQNNLENSPHSFEKYFMKSIDNKVDECLTKNEKGCLLEAYISMEHPEYTEGQTLKYFCGLDKDKQEEINKIVQNPKNKDKLIQVYKARRCSTELANIYYRNLIEKDFNKIGNFKSSSFISSKDAGNCTKGISVAVLGALNKYIDIKTLSQSKEDWAHPDSLYKTVSGRNSVPESKKLKDVMTNDTLNKGDILIVNGHHAMLYTGKVDIDNKPLCHQFTPEQTNYPLKQDKNVYVVPISSFVKALDSKNADKIIEDMLKTVENNINKQDFKKKFLDNIEELKKEKVINEIQKARVKIENKRKQSSIKDKTQTVSNNKMDTNLIDLKKAKQR